MSVITIVGAGMMGTAIGFPAVENGHEIRLVGTPLDDQIIDHARATHEHLTLKRRIPQGFRFYQFSECDEAMAGADLIVSGVSSFGVDWFSEIMIPRIPEDMPVLGVTKGMVDLENGEMISYPEYYMLKHPGRKLRLCAVGGPCTSYELADRDPTEVCFCGEEPDLLRWIKGLFETDVYHISLSTDVRGVECAVAMKNAYALGVSLAIGLSEKREGVIGREHYNSQAALFGQSVREMRRLIALNGSSDENIVYGAGDLYVTVFGGRTRKIGTLLGRGLSFEAAMNELSGVTLESIVIATRTARAVRALIGRGVCSAAEFPLLMHIDDIINHSAPVNIPWRMFETEFGAGAKA
ncbi:MAG: glycerol-3-phosphate dehydrogenase [Clostridia bacterium]|nr:glycerol-3-phosphate dehydrogenase [Clostridia bacterium]